MRDPLNSALTLIKESFSEGSIVCQLVFTIVAILALVFLLRGIYIMKKRAVESFSFILFCIPILVWGLSLFALSRYELNESNQIWLNIVIIATEFCIPVLLMLHIQSQVNYRPVTALTRLKWFILPIVLVVIWLIHTAVPSIDLSVIFPEVISPYSIGCIVFMIVVAVSAYLLCCNVFYQMPKHMRYSTYPLIWAVTVIVVAYALEAYFGLSANAGNIILAIAVMISLLALHSAFFIANSSNVIATSRDFVYSNLSTIVLTISLKGYILDWNKKSNEGCAPLPLPQYKESYEHYRERILVWCNGTVSKYDENIITVNTEDSQRHYLFSWHEIGVPNRKFGNLVEIADITEIYKSFRYIEEIALYDTLTGLNNRNAYIEEVKNISIAANMPLCLIIGDANNLKKINDSIGHLEGDRLLCTISENIRSNSPEQAFVARIGGDEFVILIKNADDEDAAECVEKINGALSQIHDEVFGTPSISWGWTIMHDESEDYNELFRKADAVMYETKKRMKELSLSGVVPGKE